MVEEAIQQITAQANLQADFILEHDIFSFLVEKGGVAQPIGIDGEKAERFSLGISGCLSQASVVVSAEAGKCRVVNRKSKLH